MTRQDYNQNKREQPLIEAGLCTWDFCDTCINTRTRHRMPIPELRSDGRTKPYFRYLNPERRASHDFYKANPNHP